MLEGCKSTDLGGSELEHLALVRSQQDEDKSSSNQSGIYPVAGRCETTVETGSRRTYTESSDFLNLRQMFFSSREKLLVLGWGRLRSSTLVQTKSSQALIEYKLN